MVEIYRWVRSTKNKDFYIADNPTALIENLYRLKTNEPAPSVIKLTIEEA